MMVCFERAVEAAGLGDFHFHDLRHTFPTRLRAANIHEYDIIDLPGHSTTPADTRNTKSHAAMRKVSRRDFRDAVNNLEKVSS
jgi:integrase